jgi:hypothetical protein
MSLLLPRGTRTHVPHAEERNVQAISHKAYYPHLKLFIRNVALLLSQHMKGEYATHDLWTPEITWIGIIQLHLFTNNTYTIHS